MAGSGFDPVAETKDAAIAPFRTQQVLTTLQLAVESRGQEGQASPDFYLAWRDPGLFEQLLDQHGPEALNRELHRLGMENCLEHTHWTEEKSAEPRVTLRVLHQVLADEELAAQFAQVVQSKTSGNAGGESPEAKGMAEFLAVTTGKAPAKPGWLSRALSGFTGVHFGNPLARLILGIFEMQSPEAQLRILLSSKAMADPEGSLEDAIHLDPLASTEAIFLEIDLPKEIDSRPEIYRRKTLDSLPDPISPISRKPFDSSKDLRAWMEWRDTSPEARFVTIVRKHLLADQNAWLKDSDILKLVQSPLLVKYIKANRLFKVFERLDQLHPWDTAVEAEWIRTLRTQLARAFFPPKNGWVPSRVELDFQVSNLEKLRQEELEAKAELARKAKAEMKAPPPAMGAPAPVSGWKRFTSCC